MKKFLALFLAVGLITSCSEKKENNSAGSEVNSVEEQKAETPKFDYETAAISFSKDKLQAGCLQDSAMACAINLALKCTIDPLFSECDKTKMPRFIFMEDESLDRPSQISYKINKIKPLSDGTVEVYTESNCDGQWFGLCKGNIIYVLTPKNDQWIVKDLYALQQF